MKSCVKIMTCPLGNIEADAFENKVSKFTDIVKRNPSVIAGAIKVTWLIDQSNRHLISIVEWCERERGDVT